MESAEGPVKAQQQHLQMGSITDWLGQETVYWYQSRDSVSSVVCTDSAPVQ